MSDLVEKKQREWRSQAVRELLELENTARGMRDLLEQSSWLHLGEMVDEAADLNSHMMTFITYVDRAAGMLEAGIE